MEKFISLAPQDLVDLFLEEGIVPNAKFHYRWEEFSKWQIESLIEIGMLPSHKLLDVGCGPMRFGIQAVNYLDDGNYYGIDAFNKYIELAPKVCELAGIKKTYKILYNNLFEFDKLTNEYSIDFAMAQSVFTHLSQRQIIDCMHKMKKVMKPGSKFLFSNITSKVARGFLYSGYIPMISGTECTDDFYNSIAKELSIKFESNVISHPTQYAHLFLF